MKPVLVPADNTFARGSRRSIVGSIDVEHTVIETTDDGRSAVGVDILFDMGYAEYQLPEISELVRRVGYAVDLVALNDRAALRLYHDKLSFIDMDSTAATSAGTEPTPIES